MLCASEQRSLVLVAAAESGRRREPEDAAKGVSFRRKWLWSMSINRALPHGTGAGAILVPVPGAFRGGLDQHSVAAPDDGPAVLAKRKHQMGDES